ncbi:MAG TPA: nicotinate-nucleotide adenylyltransferase [Blastocatellia bacterium]|nr:nicotinate-nucleotide adenylyltransferase [Blastocatellia bacterium]
MDKRRIAAFGGTFDPIHNGHVEVARAIVQKFDLDRLLMIPAHRPPHKKTNPIAGAYHRHTMAVLGLLDEARVFVSTIELESPDRPYSFETIERLKTVLSPHTKLFFIIGADSFEQINTWREPGRLLSSTSLIVVTRPGHEVKSSHLDERFRSTIVDLRGSAPLIEAVRDSGEHNIYLTNCVSADVSSTQIRQMVRDGEPIDDRVPARVADYIEKYELYRGQLEAT